MFTTALAAAPAHSALAHWGPYGGGGPGFGWLLLLIPLFWIGVIALIIALAARRRRRFWAANGGRPAFGPWGPGGAGFAGPGGVWSGHDPAAGAEKTLAERFAQGDIDEVEYRARLEVLRANRSGPAAQ